MIPRLLRPTVTWTNLSNNHGRPGGRESGSRAPPLGGAPASATTSRVTGRGTVTGRAWPKPASPHTGTVAQAEASDDCLGKPQWKAAAALPRPGITFKIPSTARGQSAQLPGIGDPGSLQRPARSSPGQSPSLESFRAF